MYSFCSGFRIQEFLKCSGFGIVCGRNHPLRAIRGAVRVFAGIHAVELLEMNGTSRNSNILHIHKSEYNLCNLPVSDKKSVSNILSF